MIIHDFAESLRIQGRVLVAIMLREARTRYGRMKVGYLWALVEPAMHIAMFSVLFSTRFVVVPLGDSVILFLATGFLVFFAFRNVLSRTSGAYGSNEALLSFPIVRVMDVFLGRALLELATSIMVLFLILGGLVLTGVAPLPHDVLKMLIAVFSLFAVGIGVGIVVGIVGEFWATLSSLMTVPLRLLYFASGLFFLPDSMPPAVRDIFVWNPVLHAVTLFREGYYHGYQSHLLDEGYLVMWAVGSVLCGLVVEKVARKPLRSLTS